MLFCVPGQYDRLAAQIVGVEQLLHTVVPGSSVHRSLAEEGHALRAALLDTPEQKALMVTWRMRKEANERRKRPLRVQPPPRTA